MRSWVVLVALALCAVAVMAEDQAKVSTSKAESTVAAAVVEHDLRSANDLAHKKFGYFRNCPYLLQGANRPDLSPFPNYIGCGGCVKSLATFHELQQRQQNYRDATDAQYIFNRACQYVEAELQPVCQQLYNVHGRTIISMMFKNHEPMDTCGCLRYCDSDDFAVLFGAAVSKTDFDASAVPAASQELFAWFQSYAKDHPALPKGTDLLFV
eukprot:gnl/Spiro4/10074_TR5348_c0_g1_i1.p1 gnl/Spiro4/10074_TR5348_c0_g1~~gnl/Spiro4/10074_TR5348_c0_g1_i1.p1  ORF type:complete len:211 (+),score=52.89 gnl/Spiro4/10074_TR5348_c0_g1_i1:42-674(+)